MLRDADLAMYRAKETGRARYEVFDSSMRAVAVKTLALETELRRALEREEFEMYYQPIVNLDGGTLFGFEALIRWNHPERGLLVPAEFAKLADDTGLIVPIGRWVVRTVCRQLRDWTETLGELARPVHVNVSAHQLARPTFVPRMQGVLEEFGTVPHLMVLELTESAMMENAEGSTLLLHQLKELGLGLSIDDFGTGYSSLSYLHRFVADSVKIDRSFVSRMGPGVGGTKIVRTIVDLAHDLGMRVVAEGIETEAQASLLRGMQCEGGQGYYFSLPVPTADATQLLASRRVW
jgi:EAL domain-containing protein (putative c-di-GMP-specific phosphodiesterase class I)